MEYQREDFLSDPYFITDSILGKDEEYMTQIKESKYYRHALSTEWLSHNKRILKDDNSWLQYLLYMDQVINTGLRKQTITQRAYDITRDILNDIDQAKPIENELVLYRGVKTMPKIKIGDRFSNLGFTSKSSDFKTALNFAGKSGCCLMIIRYRPGSKQLYLGVEKNMETAEEEEFLTYPGEIFELKDTALFHNEFNPTIKVYIFDVVGNQYSNFNQISQIVDGNIDKKYQYFLSQFIAMGDTAEDTIIQPIFGDRVGKIYINDEDLEWSMGQILISDIKKEDRELYKNYILYGFNGMYLLTNIDAVRKQFFKYIRYLKRKYIFGSYKKINSITITKSDGTTASINLDLLRFPSETPLLTVKQDKLEEDIQTLPYKGNDQVTNKILVFLWRPFVISLTITMFDGETIVLETPDRIIGIKLYKDMFGDTLNKPMYRAFFQHIASNTLAIDSGFKNSKVVKRKCE